MVAAVCIICGGGFDKRGRQKTCSKDCSAARKADYLRCWKVVNREKVAEQGRRWREANPEKEAERRRRWQEANRERHAENVRTHNRLKNLRLNTVLAMTTILDMEDHNEPI